MNKKWWDGGEKEGMGSFRSDGGRRNGRREEEKKFEEWEGDGEKWF